ncbi:MAG: hypothetical protein ACAH83_13425 [Alphaproteobacteria bacterium]
MKFSDTGLPSHPAIEKSFEVLRQFDKGDAYTTRGVLIATLIATAGKHKDPEAIAAGLLVPLAQDLGPFLCAKAELPGRVPEIIESLFAFGKTSMTGAAMDKPYADLDPAVRSVVLASSVRMFEVTAGDLENSLNNTEPAQGPDKKNIKAMLAPLRDFTDVVTRNEKDELALVKKCQEAMKRIEDSLDSAGIKLPPAAKPNTPKV